MSFKNFALKALRVIIVLSIFFSFFIPWTIKLIKDEGARLSRTTKSFQQRMSRNGVHSLTFVLDRKSYDTGDHGSVWSKLKRIYINGELANPDTLFCREDLLYKHCGDYYYYGFRDCDSVIYEFPPVNRYEMYDYKEKRFKKIMGYSLARKHSGYRHKLPKCWDDE